MTSVSTVFVREICLSHREYEQTDHVHRRLVRSNRTSWVVLHLYAVSICRFGLRLPQSARYETDRLEASGDCHLGLYMVVA